MQYPTYAQLDLAHVAQQVESFWKKNDIFRLSVQQRAGAPRFTFYDGPPSANGQPGIHHVLARALKDIFCRYKTQRGFQVERRAGWDTHGLPVELQVEKQLGITKDDIGITISVADYNAACKRTVFTYKERWDEMTRKMGYWIDLENSYITCTRDYIETVWHLLQRLYDKGLLYKGYTVQPYSPAAGSGLSTHELNQPGCYRMVKDTSVVAQFQWLREDASEGAPEVFFLAWTTTPWTLPANSALGVGAQITYLQVETFNPYTHERIQVILAEAALDRYFAAEQEVDTSEALEVYQPGMRPAPWCRVKRYQGSDLVGVCYAQLFPYVKPQGKAFEVIEADFVTTESGTGVVHIAPTFGIDDMRVARKAGIAAITVRNSAGESVPIVDLKGRFVSAITDYAGEYVKEAYCPEGVGKGPLGVDARIAIQLKKAGRAFHVAKYEHSYPHCWRTDKPVLYYPLDAWFVKTTAYKDRLQALNATINWKPRGTGSGRFGHWLAHLVDWNLSRDRFWGTPLPIWRTRDGQETRCIGSVAELCKAVDEAVAAGIMKGTLPEEFDPHRPHVDDIVLISSKGEPMYRDPAVVDVWFDSGAMPYAQWHYPFDNKAAFKAAFPADFIAEGVDQTRGWFFTLHALAVMLFDDVAFKNVIANGLVLDKLGNKMSKRHGNAIDPMELMVQHGPDVLRWYMVSNANPWENLKFDPAALLQVKRKFFGTLHNTYAFFALYANLDGFLLDNTTLPVADRPESDRWILSRLNTLIQGVTEAYDAYEVTPAVRAMQEFLLNDLSNWYVRLNRKRFWKSEGSADKQAAYATLHTCLSTLAQLAAPVAPFYMEQLYRDLQLAQYGEPTSVHLEDFPQTDLMLIDKALIAKMKAAQAIASLVHALRKQHRVKVRQPLAKMLVPVQDVAQQAQLEEVAPLILREVNVKEMAFLNDTCGLVQQAVRPNLKRLGKRYGAHIPAITQLLQQLSQEEIQAFETQGKWIGHLPTGKTVELSLEDVLISSQDIPGWTVAREGPWTVALDLALTGALKQEGVARELVNKLQNLRKAKGFDVQDKVCLEWQTANDWLHEAIVVHEAYLCQEVQVAKLHFTAEELPEGIVMDLGEAGEVRVRLTLA